MNYDSENNDSKIKYYTEYDKIYNYNINYYNYFLFIILMIILIIFFLMIIKKYN